MNLSPASNLMLAGSRRGCRVAKQAEHQMLEVEPSIEPIREGTEVVSGVLSKLECLVAAIGLAPEERTP